MAASDEEHSECAKEVEHLHFDLPRTRLAERKNIAAVSEQGCHEHVEGKDRSSDASSIADNHKERRDHFANDDAPGDKLGNALGRKHGCDTVDPSRELADAVWQHHQAEAAAQEQLSEVSGEEILKHGAG